MSSVFESSLSGSTESSLGVSTATSAPLSSGGLIPTGMSQRTLNSVPNPNLRLGEMVPREWEFLAEQQVWGTVGPLNPPREASVPLWLALQLRKSSQCTIIPPAWLCLEQLSQWLEQEKDQHAQFVPLPRFFFEICKILLESAPEDVATHVGSHSNAPLNMDGSGMGVLSQVRALVYQIREERLAKVQAGVKSGLNGVVVQLTGLTPFECTSIRPFMTRAMDQLSQLGQ